MTRTRNWLHLRIKRHAQRSAFPSPRAPPLRSNGRAINVSPRLFKRTLRRGVLFDLPRFDSGRLEKESCGEIKHRSRCRFVHPWLGIYPARTGPTRRVVRGRILGADQHVPHHPMAAYHPTQLHAGISALGWTNHLRRTNCPAYGAVRSWADFRSQAKSPSCPATCRRFAFREDPAPGPRNGSKPARTRRAITACIDGPLERISCLTRGDRATGVASVTSILSGPHPEESDLY